jgi:hypothetical protein
VCSDTPSRDKGCSISCWGLFTLKGSIQEKNINIVVNQNHEENYINIDLANQLLIPEPNIVKNKDDVFCRGQYEIKNLQVSVDDYEYISEFNVTTMFRKEIDISLGLHWFKNLSTFILNMEKTFLTFYYKRKKMTYLDIAMKLDLIVPSSNDLKDISRVILQENQWSI